MRRTDSKRQQLSKIVFVSGEKLLLAHSCTKCFVITLQESNFTIDVNAGRAKRSNLVQSAKMGLLSL